MMTSDEIRELYAQMASKYDQRVFQEKDYVAFEKIPSWICKYMGLENPSVKALDLGCGTGLSSAVFFKHGYHVTGIDITPEMIEEAKKLPYERLICKSLEGLLPFDSKEFHVAVLLGVMEFIVHPKNLFQEVRRVLKDTGLFGLTVPMKLSQEKETKLQIFSYTKEHIEAVFQSCGFSIVFEEKIPGFMSEGEIVSYYAYILKPF